MLRILSRVEGWFAAFNRVALGLTRRVAIGLLAVMTVVVVAAVFFRYVLNDALPWSEEIAKFLMVWMTFMAAPIAYRQGALVAVDALPNALKGRLHQLLIVFVQCVVIAIMVVFIKEGSFLTWNARIQTASTIELSISYVYISMPLGALVLMTVSIELMLRAMREIVHPSPPRDPSEPTEEIPRMI